MTTAVWADAPTGRVEERADLSAPRLLAVAALHAVVGILMHDVDAIAMAHAAASVCVGLWLLCRAPLSLAPAVIAYFAGSEILWRATESRMPWEGTKYLVALGCIVILVRLRSAARIALAPVLYFALLLPSCLVILARPDAGAFSEWRHYLSSGMAAPLALALAAWAFSHFALDERAARRMLLGFVLPSVALGAMTAFTTYTNPDIQFGTESNSDTSGGFGPNQVSTSLGLGALLAVLVAFDANVALAARGAALALGVGLAVQCAMTFSRGGLYAAIGALLVGVVFWLPDRRARRRFAMAMLLLVGAGATVFPAANAYTGGALLARFQDTDPTSRDAIASDDVRLLRENFLLGVGPSAARDHRLDKSNASHTEFTRLLAEHGLLGIVAMLVILGAAVLRLLRATDTRERALVAALFAWAALSMLHAAMRTVAPPVIVGLAFASFLAPRSAAPRAYGLVGNVRRPHRSRGVLAAAEPR